MKDRILQWLGLQFIASHVSLVLKSNAKLFSRVWDLKSTVLDTQSGLELLRQDFDKAVEGGKSFNGQARVRALEDTVRTWEDRRQRYLALRREEREKRLTTGEKTPAEMVRELKNQAAEARSRESILRSQVHELDIEITNLHGKLKAHREANNTHAKNFRLLMAHLGLDLAMSPEVPAKDPEVIIVKAKKIKWNGRLVVSTPN